VSQRFAAYPNVTVTRGVVPDVLGEGLPEAIAFLLLDMNAAAEVGGLDALFFGVSEGGIVLINDYSRAETQGLHARLRDWMAAHGCPVLELPTGPGLVVKHA